MAKQTDKPDTPSNTSIEQVKITKDGLLEHNGHLYLRIPESFKCALPISTINGENSKY